MIYTTERLIARKINKDDVGHLLEMNNNPKVMKYISSKDFNPVSAQEEMSSINRQIAYYKKYQSFGLWMIETPSDSIGWISLKYNNDLQGYEVGYRLKETYWGSGYCTEAVKGAIHYAKKVGVKKVYAVAMVDNMASISVMKKVGMTFEEDGHLYNEKVKIYAINI